MSLKSGRADLQYGFLGQATPLEENLITALEFDNTGDMVAAGTRCGRVVLYRRNRSGGNGSLPPTPSNLTPPGTPKSGSPSTSRSASPSRKTFSPGRKDEKGDKSSLSASGRESPEGTPAPPGAEKWSVFHEFVSHTPVFDYLKSVELEPKINALRWFQPVGVNGSACLLSCNDKTIKLWKITQQDYSFIPNCVSSYGGASEASRSSRDLALPYKTARLPGADAGRASTRRVYKDAHAYHINSVDICADRESFLSADDLRINLWRTERTDVSLTYVDIKPDNMEDLAEVITLASFHPAHSYLLAYATSKGTVKLVDSRQRCLAHKPVRQFEEEEPEELRGFFSEIVASVSGMRFDPSDPHRLFTRDYMSCRLWDLRMEGHAVRTVHVHEHLRPFLNELYEADAMCDKFGLGCSHDGKKFVTGSYNHQFVVKNSEGQTVSLGQLPPEDRPLAHGAPYSFAPQAYPLQLSASSGSTPMSTRSRSHSRTEFPKADFLSSAADEQLGDPGLGTPIQALPIPRGAGQPDIRTDQKCVHVSWHPHKDVFAVASATGVYIYNV